MRALDIAWQERGVHEVGFNNRGKRVEQYQRADGLPGTGYSWCMSFVQWCYLKANHPLPNLTASVGLFLNYARKVGWVVQKPARGDLICFNFDADNWPDHVGFVVRVMPLSILTVEGNTSPSAKGSQSDGGGVYTRVRRKSSRNAYVRVPGK